jgi:M6 family metalloprotease-like protein
MRRAVVLALFAVLGLAGPVGAQTPAGETVITDAPKPPPLLQGSRVSPFPCGLDGTLLDAAYQPSKGTLKALMLFVDFSDAPGEGTDPQTLYDGFVPQSVTAFQALSRATFNLDVEPALQWVRMPKPYADYGFVSGGAPSFAIHHGYISDAIAAADPSVDFSKYSLVYVVSAPGADQRSAADVGAIAEPLHADGVDITAAATLGSSTAYVRNFTTLVHETGHLLGLKDLYSYESGASDFVGPWDIMSATLGNNTPMLSWSRLLLGWLGKHDFRCVTRTTTAKLTPVTDTGKPNALVVRTGLGDAFVVEARTDQVGRGCTNPGGVLVYQAAAKEVNGVGPLQLVDDTPDDQSCGTPHSGAAFIPGSGKTEYVEPHGRFVVRVLRRTGDTFDVQLEIPDTACVVPKVGHRSFRRAAARLRAAGCRPGGLTIAPGRGKKVVSAQTPPAGTVLVKHGRVALTLKSK